MMPSCLGVVSPRLTRSAATACEIVIGVLAIGL